MSAIQRAWSKKFSAEGRANRAEFWLFCLVIGLLYLVLSFVVGMIFGLAQVEQEYLIIPIIVIWIFVLILQIFLLIRRVHDFDCSGALALLILVPIAPIVLGLIPGTPGPNRFGLPPGGGYGPPPGGGGYGPPPGGGGYGPPPGGGGYGPPPGGGYGPPPGGGGYGPPPGGGYGPPPNS